MGNGGHWRGPLDELWRYGIVRVRGSRFKELYIRPVRCFVSGSDHPLPSCELVDRQPVLIKSDWLLLPIVSPARPRFAWL